jgi:hypothetical protein
MAGAIGSKRRRWTKGGPPFLKLPRFIKRSQAFHELSCEARCALLEILDRYNGTNNGAISLSVRECAYSLGTRCKATASRALTAVDDSGLARPQEVGVWRGRRATTWRLAWLRCDVTGDLPNKTWAQSHQRDTKVSPEGHKPSLSLTGGTHERNSSMNESALSLTRGTHIDIYHGDSAEVAPAPVDPWADLDIPPAFDRRARA